MLWGESCCACGKLDAADEVLCPACAADFQRELVAHCPDCGAPMVQCYCSRPHMRDVGCGYLVKLAMYEAADRDRALNRLIYRLKRIPDRECAALIAELWRAPCTVLLSDRGVDMLDVIVTYVPRDRDKILIDGHDQARLLATALANELGAECFSLLERKRGSREQKSLSADAREKNVRSLFSLSRKIDPRLLRHKSVLLVDDLVTTGATVAACADVLLSGGAENVFAVSIAAVKKIFK